MLERWQFAKLWLSSGASARGVSLRGLRLSAAYGAISSDVGVMGPRKGAFACLRLCVVNQNKKKTALQMYLKTGEIVICNFDTGFVPPEMVKSRPALVFSKSSTHWRGLCSVVPFSTTPPDRVEPWHVLVKNPLHRRLPQGQRFGQAAEMWAKCDMITTVSFARITRPYDWQCGVRKYAAVRLSDADLDAVFTGIRAYLPSPR